MYLLDTNICIYAINNKYPCGLPIGLYDVMIAAQGISRNFTVITHNIDEFSRIPAIKIQDWVQEENNFEA